MGLSENLPRASVGDLVYYSGLFAGIIAVFLVTRPYGVPPIVSLIGGIVVGVGFGYVLERAYRNGAGPGRPPGSDRSSRRSERP